MNTKQSQTITLSLLLFDFTQFHFLDFLLVPIYLLCELVDIILESGMREGALLFLEELHLECGFGLFSQILFACATRLVRWFGTLRCGLLQAGVLHIIKDIAYPSTLSHELL